MRPPVTPQTPFARHLRAALARSGISSQELARRLGVHPTSISNWVRGVYAYSHNSSPGEPCVPSRKHVREMAPLLGEPVDLLLLLAGYAPEMPALEAYRRLQPDMARERKEVAL